MPVLWVSVKFGGVEDKLPRVCGWLLLVPAAFKVLRPCLSATLAVYWLEANMDHISLMPVLAVVHGLQSRESSTFSTAIIHHA